MNIEQFSIAMIARTMYRAGFRYGPPHCALLAELSGHVVRNQVIHALGQVGWLEALAAEEASFRWTEDPEAANPPAELTRAENPAFLRLLWLAERLYLQQEPDKVNGADRVACVPPSGVTPALTVAGLAGRTYYFTREGGPSLGPRSQ